MTPLDRRSLVTSDGTAAVVRASTPSTHDDARQLAVSGEPHGTWVVAERQTAGRGRLGRAWSMPPEAGLAISVLLRPRLAPHEVPLLCLAAAVAVAGLHPRLQIKWPNDVLLPDGRKVCGILAEAEPGDDGVSFVLLGLGVNVHAAPPLPTAGHLDELQPATPWRREAIAVGLVEEVLRWTARLEAGGVDDLVTAWTERSYTTGRRVRVGSVEGIATGIDASGALWVQTDDGQRRAIVAGDVELVRW